MGDGTDVTAKSRGKRRDFRFVAAHDTEKPVDSLRREQIPR